MKEGTWRPVCTLDHREPFGIWSYGISFIPDKIWASFLAKTYIKIAVNKQMLG